MKLNIITTLLIIIVAISGVGIVAGASNAPIEYFPMEGSLKESFSNCLVNGEIDFETLVNGNGIKLYQNSITYNELSYLLEGITKAKMPEKVRMKYNSIIVGVFNEEKISATIKMTVNVNTKAFTAKLLGIKKEYLSCDASFILNKDGEMSDLNFVCDGENVNNFFMELAASYAFGHKDYKGEIKSFFDIIINTFGCVDKFTHEGVVFFE